jgi:hypothetical protein
MQAWMEEDAMLPMYAVDNARSLRSFQHTILKNGLDAQVQVVFVDVDLSTFS